MAGKVDERSRTRACMVEGARKKVVFYDVDLTLIDQRTLGQGPEEETQEERVNRVAGQLNPELVALASDPNTMVVFTTSWDMSQTRVENVDIFRRTIADALCRIARKDREAVKIVVTGSEYMEKHLEKHLGSYYDEVVGPFEDLMIEYARRQSEAKSPDLAAKIKSIQDAADQFLEDYNDKSDAEMHVVRDPAIMTGLGDAECTTAGSELDRLRQNITAMLYALQNADFEANGKPKGKKSMYEHVISKLESKGDLREDDELIIFDDNWSAVSNRPANVPDGVEFDVVHVCAPRAGAWTRGARDDEESSVWDVHHSQPPTRWSHVSMSKKLPFRFPTCASTSHNSVWYGHPAGAGTPVGGLCTVS